jgi:purine-nucleoside phosphorylase
MSEQNIDVVARLEESIISVRSRTVAFGTPRIGVVLGSGLGAFGDTLAGALKVPYGEVPHIPPSRVLGHAGNFVFGHVESMPVVCMQGRVHGYEGHAPWQVVHGVRLMARLGAKAILLTNAAGGLEPSWAAGDLMIVTDHLNLMSQHPLVGPNDDGLGTRFPDMTNAYDPGLRKKLATVAAAAGIPLRQGVYAGLPGPSYETPAEIKMLRILGANAVGMSTVPEVIALRHMRVPVAALSCITNLAAGVGPGELDHAEVEATAKARRVDLERLLRGWILAAGAP